MNLEEFKLLYHEKQQSNLSIKDFMLSKGVPVHRYYYWAKKLSNMTGDDRSNSFVQIVPNVGVSLVTVEYPNGVKINFNEIPSLRLLVEMVNIRK